MTVPLGASIQAAVDANPPGTTLQLSAGVYRMQTVYPKYGDQILGALDAAGKRLTTLSGAQSLTSFTKDQYGNYVATTTQTQPGQQTGACNWGYSRCNLPEDFFFDNDPYMHNSIGPASLTAGQYFFDYPNGRIFFRPRNAGDDPTQHTVEYSRTRVALAGTQSPGVTVKNVIVEKYAVPAQFGAIGDQYPADGWVLQNVETRFNHGQGLRVAGNSQVLDSYSHDNGQMGMGGSGNNILLQGNEIAHNIDYTGTDCGWECGGFKFAFTDNLVVRDNYSHDNVGPGMWTDINNIRTLYENNRIESNSGAGLFHEISYDAVIRNNTIRNNGSMAPDDWFWNGQIQISTSSNVEAYGNVIEVNSATNGNGIMLIQQNRSNDACSYGPCRVANSYIHDNHITVTGTRWHATSGAAQDFVGYGDIFNSNNRFEGNHYHVMDVNSNAHWDWVNDYRSFNQFKSFGLELNGTVDSNVSGDPMAPTVPTGLTANAVSGTQITLTWNASTDNVGVTGYRIYRNGAQIATSAGASYTDGSLTLTTPYSYAVAAFDAAGNVSSQSGTASATTKGDSSAPTVPNGLTATAVSNTQISLTWNASTDDLGVTGYRIYRNGGQVGTSASPSYTDSGLTWSTGYLYTLAAVDAAGNVSAQSGSAAATTKGDTNAPTTPTGLTATAISGTQIGLTWDAATDDAGVTGYRIYRNGGQVGTSASTSFTDNGLSLSTAYTYSVAAFDAAGNLSAQSGAASATTKGDAAAPTVPAGLAASAISSTQISLVWGAATDNIGVTGYRIYRNGAQVGTSGPTSYTDSGLASSTAYTYSVAAVDAAGNVSGQSGMASATTRGDTTAPSVPGGLSASGISSSQISLTWGAATDNIGVAGYRVYRGGAQIATTTATSYTDNGLAPSTGYSYSVAAFDAAGNVSGQSGSASATTRGSVWQRGSRVITTTSITVRNKPATNASAKSLGTQPSGARGTITQGPQSGGGVTWWYVQFDSGASGWVQQSWLALN